MKYIKLSIITIVFILSSCGNKNKFLLPTTEIDSTALQFDTIWGKQVDIDVVGAREIYSFDNLLFIESKDPKAFVKVYSLGNYDSIAELCAKGRASNEFINPRSVCKQLYKDGDHIMLLMFDNVDVQKTVDVTESIEKHYTVVSKSETSLTNETRGSSVYNNVTDEWFVNKRVSYIDPRDHIYFPPQFYFSKNGVEKEVPVISELMNFPEDSSYPLYVYEGDLRLKPDGSKISFTCYNMPYIYVFDANNKTGKAFHECGKLSYNDDYESDDVTDIDLFYLDACVTDDYIICVYGDGKQSEYDANKRPIIKFFNWDGKCLFGFYPDQRIYNIAYDDNAHKLIGLDVRTEKVYEYDVQEFLL